MHPVAMHAMRFGPVAYSFRIVSEPSILMAWLLIALGTADRVSSSSHSFKTPRGYLGFDELNRPVAVTV